MYKRGPEKAIEHKMLTWLNSIKNCFAFKVNTMGVYDKKKKLWRKNNSQHIHNGTHDIIFCYDGKFGTIEAKAGKNKASEDQLIFMGNIHDAKGWSIVTNNVEDLKTRFISNFGPIKYRPSDAGDEVLFDETF